MALFFTELIELPEESSLVWLTGMAPESAAVGFFRMCTAFKSFWSEKVALNMPLLTGLMPYEL